MTKSEKIARDGINRYISVESKKINLSPAERRALHLRMIETHKIMDQKYRERVEKFDGQFKGSNKNGGL